MLGTSIKKNINFQEKNINSFLHPTKNMYICSPKDNRK